MLYRIFLKAWHHTCQIEKHTCSASESFQLQAIQCRHCSFYPGVHRWPIFSVDVSARRKAICAKLVHARIKHLATGAEVSV